MPKTNNFDLIRLFAALQVAVSHSMLHLGVAAHDCPLCLIADLFPGVPIFFFISGFLISRSFEKNSVVKEFALNRVLRIYPGLAVCFILSVMSVWLSGHFRGTGVAASGLLAWVVAQLSIVQFYNPDFMRGYGVGVLNGSTWTISVELQFYILVPLLYALLRLKSMPKWHSNSLLGCLILGFLAVNQAYLHGASAHCRPLWYKVAGVSFAPWFYMFLVGVLFQRNFDVLQRWLGGKFLLVFCAYCAFALAAVWVGWSFGDSLNPLLFLALSIVTFATAFSANTLSDRMIRRNDLSYGVYIYHMPVANFLIAERLGAGAGGVLVTVMMTLALAYASWRLVEKPALGFKRHPLYQHRSQIRTA